MLDGVHFEYDMGTLDRINTTLERGIKKHTLSKKTIEAEHTIE
jgi:hypothetical protein